VARYRAEGNAAFKPRSRRPRSSPRALSDTTIELIVAIRDRLVAAGQDAGADTFKFSSRPGGRMRTIRGLAFVRHTTGDPAVTDDWSVATSPEIPVNVVDSLGRRS
jgi:hypothetical protein